ncbi:MAG: alpha-amylase family glycosyl hydrolase, partial [Actinomycetes bacterium]
RWFQEALASPPGSPARDRYVFRNGKGPNGDQPPSDWRSVFGGTAWERVPDGQWYLHLFDVKQPDLNWDNPEVRAEFEAILRFWLDRGVDGFRIDVAHGLVKDLSEPLRDVGSDEHEEKLLSATGGHDHPYWDRDGVHDVYRAWHRVLAGYSPPRMAVAEAWVDSPSRRGMYVRPDELQQAFNFDFLRSKWNVTQLRDVIDGSLSATDAVGAATTWVLSNHDVIRHPTRYALPQDADEEAWLMTDGQDPRPDLELGTRRARAAALLMLALPGSAYVYQGEELGLREVAELPHEVLQDPVWERTGHTRKGRDGCRVPLPWDASESADGGSSYGFGPGGSWLPQPDDWASHARDVETGTQDSMLRLYQEALRLRHELGGDGSLEWLPDIDPAVALGFRRDTGLVCVVNFGDAPLELPEGTVLLASGDLEGGKLPQDTAVWLRR